MHRIHRQMPVEVVPHYPSVRRAPIFTAPPTERGERTRRRRGSWGTAALGRGDWGGVDVALLAPSVRPSVSPWDGTKTGKAQKHDRYKQCASEAPLIVVRDLERGGCFLI